MLKWFSNSNQSRYSGWLFQSSWSSIYFHWCQHCLRNVVQVLKFKDLNFSQNWMKFLDSKLHCATLASGKSLNKIPNNNGSVKKCESLIIKPHFLMLSSTCRQRINPCKLFKTWNCKLKFAFRISATND